METVRVKIKGIAPLLMHRFVIENQDEAKRRDVKYDIKSDAEKALYKNGDGCYVPASWLEACMRDTAKGFKGQGRSSLKTAVVSSVLVSPLEIPLGKEIYDEIDVRAVTIQKHRIARARPRFNGWELEFVIQFDEAKIKKETLRQILEECGKSVGVGDYRPKFGRFEVVEFN